MMDIKELVTQVKPFVQGVFSDALRDCFAEAERMLAGKVTFQYFRDFIELFLPVQPNNQNEILALLTVRAVDCAWRMENGWYATAGAKARARAIIRRAEMELLSRIR